jgi:hypothetical protein
VTCDVAIIGAGPYGLFAAAHLGTLKGLVDISRYSFLGRDLLGALRCAGGIPGSIGGSKLRSRDCTLLARRPPGASVRGCVSWQAPRTPHANSLDASRVRRLFVAERENPLQPINALVLE